MKSFEEVVLNSNNKIHFNLKGIPDVAAAVAEGATNGSRITSWELYMIKSNPQALARTTFYDEVGNIVNPFK
ncbi:hypothetical protein ACFOW1_01835 [Parasediminibacterium paludis]|uniref:YD repeat-containing protein n=1 Tax=Parasediminibacterium paludis TaxID=908966 RepID=A0ABV8PRW2_9BACT